MCFLICDLTLNKEDAVKGRSGHDTTPAILRLEILLSLGPRCLATNLERPSVVPNEMRREGILVVFPSLAARFSKANACPG